MIQSMERESLMRVCESVMQEIHASVCRIHEHEEEARAPLMRVASEYWRGRLPIIRTREVQAVVCNHSLHRVYVIYTLGDCTLLELANHVYCVVGGIL